MSASDFNGRSRIEYLRSRVSLLALAGQFTQMRHYGRAEWVGLCCFHPEAHPSLFVNVESGRFFCHGCQAGGDIFRFLEILLACDFRESVRQVARIAAGKPLSLPPVGLAALPANRCQGVKGGGAPLAAARAERLREARERHSFAVRLGAMRALLEREKFLPLCIRGDLGLERHRASS